MRAPRYAFLLLCVLVGKGSATVQAQSKARMPAVMERRGTAVLTRAPGGGVQIVRGVSTVSARSSLQLDWFMVSDSSLSIVFDEPVGATGVFDDPWYRYASDMKMRALVPLKAFEVRILTFNIWGEFTGTLSFTPLEDLTAGQRKSFDRMWGIFGESQLRAHFTSIAYVASVMLADGKVVIADPALALKAAKAIQASITLQDLQPKPEPMPTSARKS